MFVIPCKYNKEYPAIQQIVEDIRKFHPDETICVVDSNSDDKSYFEDLKKFKNIIIEDISNKHWMIGAYWYVYKKYPNEDFYYFLHDSMRIKDNLDYLKEKDVTIFLYFSRSIKKSFDGFSDKINNETKYHYKYGGLGILGPVFFCKNKVMLKMLEMNADKILPNTKEEAEHCEGCYGFFLEEQGYNMKECSMFGDVFDINNHFSDGPNYSNSERAKKRFFPIEKYILSLVDKKRQ